MDGPQAIIALVFVALVMVAGAIAVDYSAEETAPEYDVNESTTTGSIGTIATFPNSSLEGAYYSETATVTNSSGVVLDNATDYRWYASNGTLTVLSQDAANQTVYADYTLSDPTQEQQTVSRGLAFLTNTGAYIPLVLFVGLLVIALSLFGGLA